MLNNTVTSSELPEMLSDFLTAVRNPHTHQLGIMDRTDRPHYDKFCDGIIGCLNPANPLERQLAFAIASDYWRLNRVRNIEDGIFAASHPNPTSDFGPTPIDKQIAASQTSAFLCRQSDFKFLSTWEMRIERMLNRNKSELRQLQAERRKLESERAAPQAAQPDLGPVFKANQQSGLIPTNTETQRYTRGHGFAFSDSLVQPPAPEPTPAKTAVEAPAKVRIATNWATVIPFNPASRTGIAPDGFAFSRSATAAIQSQLRTPSTFAKTSR